MSDLSIRTNGISNWVQFGTIANVSVPEFFAATCEHLQAQIIESYDLVLPGTWLKYLEFSTIKSLQWVELMVTGIGVLY